jgi:hypothetical protein
MTTTIAIVFASLFVFLTMNVFAEPDIPLGAWSEPSETDANFELKIAISTEPSSKSKVVFG